MALADTIEPMLTSLMLPEKIDVTNGGKNLSFTIGATDEGLGVDRVLISFDKSCHDQYSSQNYLYSYDSTDSFSDGLSSGKFYVSSQSGAGTYTMRSISVYDKAGDSTYYTATQLADMGFQTSFMIVDRSVTIAASATIAEDGGQPLKISVAMNNVAQASGTVTMSFAAASSTVTNGTDVSVPNTAFS